jgi:hypothetical protein
VSQAHTLDRDRIRVPFDLRTSYNAYLGGGFTADPCPIWHQLREQAEVHEGTVHALTGHPGDLFFQGLPEAGRPHYSAFRSAPTGCR